MALLTKAEINITVLEKITTVELNLNSARKQHQPTVSAALSSANNSTTTRSLN